MALDARAPHTWLGLRGASKGGGKTAYVTKTTIVSNGTAQKSVTVSDGCSTRISTSTKGIKTDSTRLVAPRTKRGFFFGLACARHAPTPSHGTQAHICVYGRLVWPRL